MGRHHQTGFNGASRDHDLAIAQAWSAAFDSADIRAAADDGHDACNVDEGYAVDACDLSGIEDDPQWLIALRPNRRLRQRCLACHTRPGQRPGRPAA